MHRLPNARSRKAIVAVAVTAAGMLAMAGVAAAAHGGSNTNTEVVHHHRHGQAKTTTSASSVTTAVTTGTTATTVEHARPEPGDDNGVGTVGRDANDDHGVDAAAHDVNDDNGVDPVGHDANDDHGDDATTTPVTTGVTTSSLPDETSTTVAGVPNGVRTFTVTGGTVTVDVENGVVSLVSATPNAGFTIDKSESRSDRVEVEFRGNDTQSRVRVRIDGGRLRVETEDH